ncbi:MAG TPA: TetR/AcrR family transcriptional regulator [Flavobacteriia bacterium]|nr:TetR/AcrR family transcriptional regulator [Flavobacteriia bacterium]
MTKTRKHKAKEEYLLDKGIEALWCNGYNGTSVNDIVKAAGIPKGSFYFYFDSKEDFVAKAIDRYFGKMAAPIIEILQHKNFSAKQRLINFYEYKNRLMIDTMKCKYGCMGSNLGNEMSDHSEMIRNRILMRENTIKQHIINVFLEAQQNKEINAAYDAAGMVDFIEDAAKGALITMKEKQSAEPLDNFLSFVKELFLN